MMTDKHKAITKEFRAALKNEEVKALCSAYESCGEKFIRVSPVAAELLFSEDEQRDILNIAISLGLTWVRGMKINPEQFTHGHGAHFVIPQNLW